MAPNYLIDPIEVGKALDPDSVGVGAIKSGIPGLVGAGSIQIGQCRIQGRLVPYGLLHSLVVHPDHRGQGIATQLTKWRLNCVREKLGDNFLKLALIQENNKSSLAVARQWHDQLGGRLQTAVLPTSSKPVAPLSNIEIRHARAAELNQVAQGMNRFYKGYELYKPETAVSLNTWLSQSPFSQSIRHYYAAVNQQGELLAGIGVALQHEVVTMQVTRMPAVIRGLNKLVRIVPDDGILRQVSVSRLWFAPEQLQVACYLWDVIRFKMQKRATHLVITFDPKSEITRIIRLPFWLPRANFSIAAAGAIPIQFDKLLYPI